MMAIFGYFMLIMFGLFVLTGLFFFLDNLILDGIIAKKVRKCLE